MVELQFRILGEVSVTEVARRILADELITGEPWKLPNATGFVVPLLGRPPFAGRNYVLLQEVNDKVKFTDGGIVGKVNVENRSGEAVFVRKGTMLKGQSGQDRAPISGVVLEPVPDKIEIPVNCIHASRPTSHGGIFYASGVTPHGVYSALGNQGETWNSIRRHSASSRSMRRAGGHAAQYSMAMASVPHDDLVSIEESVQGVDEELFGRGSPAVEKAKQGVEDALSKIPGDLENQVGVAIFDMAGIVSVEAFDHPDSWMAFSKSILRSYRDILTAESELVELKMERAVEVLRRFLAKFSGAQRTLSYQNKVSKVFILRGEGVEGEVAEVEGREIHAILTRVEANHQDEERWRRIADVVQRTVNIPHFETQREPQTADLRWTTPTTTPNTTGGYGPSDWFNWYRRKGSDDIINYLSETPLRFSDIAERTQAARATVSSRLHEAEDIGIVQKSIRRSNGSPVYELTPKGENVKRKLAQVQS